MQPSVMDPPSILVVDDEAAIRILLEDLLTDAGYSVLKASNGEEALRLLDAAPSLVILDLNMPIMNGRQFLERWRANGPAERILVLSAHEAHAVAEEFGVRGLSKPYDLDELLALVGAMLDDAPTPARPVAR